MKKLIKPQEGCLPETREMVAKALAGLNKTYELTSNGWVYENPDHETTTDLISISNVERSGCP